MCSLEGATTSVQNIDYQVGELNGSEYEYVSWIRLGATLAHQHYGMKRKMVHNSNSIIAHIINSVTEDFQFGCPLGIHESGFAWRALSIYLT